MKKLTKKQQKALEQFIHDLDELDNKPRRLFQSMIDMAENFVEEKDKEDKLHKEQIIDSIVEFQEIYYKYLSLEGVLKSLFNNHQRTKRDLASFCNTKKTFKIFENDSTKDEYDNLVFGYKSGVRDALDLYYSKMLKDFNSEFLQIYKD